MSRGKNSKVRSTSWIKPSTTQKIIAISVGLLLVKILWNFLGASTSDQTLDLSSGSFNKQGFISDFKPSSCVMEDGKCKPIEQAIDPSGMKGLYAHKDGFYLDGLPFRILSGSFHYFRTHPAQWGDRLLRMQAAGLNTVMTYVPWNLHEKQKGRYEFASTWDIASFIEQVKKVGLKMIVRPGPYICAEWDYGGLPSWLLRDPDLSVRSKSCPSYIKHVEEYFTQLLPILAGYGYKRGGPIIAFQIENEFGSYGVKDPEYLMFLKDQYEKYGMEELIFTSDGDKQLSNGTLRDVLATVNFVKNPERSLDALQEYQPNKPMLVTEFWAGWFDHWYEKHHHYNLTSFKDRLSYIFERKASVNFYMFVGGTNFGFWNGANYNKERGVMPTVTSYDYDAAVSEHGAISERYHVIRDLIRKYLLGPVDIPPIPRDPETTSYNGEVQLTEYIGFKNVYSLVNQSKIKVLNEPETMEMLDINGGSGQGYGYILYTADFVFEEEAKTLDIEGTIEDAFQIFINGKEIYSAEYNSAPPKRRSIALPSNDLDTQNTVQILVENAGRVNFKHITNPEELLNEQHKGIKGRVSISNKPLTEWQHVPLEFDEYFYKQVQKDNAPWEAIQIGGGPSLFRGYFGITEIPKDTFINMPKMKWGKGIILVNGWNLGRYNKVGPQQTLYVPSPILGKGKNEVLVFELKTGQKKVLFERNPDLGEVDPKEYYV